MTCLVPQQFSESVIHSNTKMRIKEIISLAILLTVIRVKADPNIENKVLSKGFLAKFYEDTDNDSNVCNMSCETEVNKMMERIDAMDKNLDKLLARDCKVSESSFKMESKILSVNKSYESELQKLLEPAVGDKQNWALCYRHSTDDDLSSGKSVFHSKCDGKRNTVIIVKVGDYVFGGYADIPWKELGGYAVTPNAFIFSLRNKEGVQPFKSVLLDPNFAILSHERDAGPRIGGWNDFTLLSPSEKQGTGKSSYSKLGNGSGYRLPSSVENAISIDYIYLAGTFRFEPDEVEAFYLD